jgi:hypothetical protein
MEVMFTMRTNNKDTDSVPTPDMNQHFSGQPDYMSRVENQLKMLWSEYVQHLDQNGFNDKAKALKEKYFNLYRSYRHNRNWKNAIINN